MHICINIFRHLQRADTVVVYAPYSRRATFVAVYVTLKPQMNHKVHRKILLDFSLAQLSVKVIFV